ncbi:MAG TPA: XdhC family protein [Geobacteraceae bacterium]
MDDVNIYEELIRLQRSGVAAALATVVESSGSSPRKAGAKMLVKSDGSIMGTIGGGKVEQETIEAARKAISTGLPCTLPFVLTEDYGHVCGGRLLVYIEPAAMRPHLVIIGAGHVGKALTTAAKLAGFRVMVVDERPGFVSGEVLPDADETFAGLPGAALTHFAVSDTSSIVIATTGYEQDFAAVREALRSSARYIGVIGSRRKREVLVQTLTSEGYSSADIGRVTIPVGLSIGAETPAEIAVAVVAQLIQSRRNHGVSISDSSGSGEIGANGKMQATAACP